MMDNKFQNEFAETICSDYTSNFARIALISGPPMGVDPFHEEVAQEMRQVAVAHPDIEPHEAWENAWCWRDWLGFRPAWFDSRFMAARLSGSLEEIGPEQIAELREWMSHSPDDAPEAWTCDGCTQAGTCPDLFDSYNTNGDCLADK